MEYGLQLFSVRDVTEQDMEGALRQVAEMGYRSVEFAGFFGHSAQEIKGWLDKYGLTASGTHTGMSELTGDKLQETIAYHQAIGCRNLIVPYESFATKGEIDAFIQRVQQVEPQLNAAGITLHYHNHDHEFKPNQDGLIPEEELLARTNLLLEVDTYWVYAAGKDPVAFLQEHKDRIRVIHLKDGKGGDACASLGQGIAPVAQVRQAAIQLGLEMAGLHLQPLDPLPEGDQTHDRPRGGQSGQSQQYRGKAVIKHLQQQPGGRKDHQKCGDARKDPGASLCTVHGWLPFFDAAFSS